MPPALTEALDRARHFGYLGNGPVDTHLRHALGFVAALASVDVTDPATFLDLGSGAGLPGLVLAAQWPSSAGLLLDSNLRRTQFLEGTVQALGWDGRVSVLRARAEDAGRDPQLRGSQTLVVARSFGPPAVVAECAAPLLATGAVLAVSEPPADSPSSAELVGERWPEEGLAEFGLVASAEVRGEFGYRLLRQAHPCPDRFPRRSGIPAKRPLF